MRRFGGDTYSRRDGKTLDLSSKLLGAGGAVIVGALISSHNWALLVKFDISNNGVCAAGGKAIAEGLKNNHILKEFNLAGNSLGKVGTTFDAAADISGVIAISDTLLTMGALTSLNISANSIGTMIPPEGWTHYPDDRWEYKHTNGRKQDRPPDGSKPEGVIALAGAIRNNRALVKLIMGDNILKGEEAGKALGDALAVNTVLKELDLSSPKAEFNSEKSDPEFAKAFSVGLSANGALVKFTISNNELRAGGAKALAEALKGNQVMRELGFSGNVLSWSDDFDTDMGVSAIANTIPTMGAVVRLDISNNMLTAGNLKLLAEALKANNTLTELNLAENEATNDGDEGTDMSGVIALAVAIATMGALTDLNMSNNNIGQLVLPEGWQVDYEDGKSFFYGPNDEEYQDEPP